MKKLNFLGAIFFAFQTMALAQTNFEISAGTGTWWETGKLKYVEKPPSSPLFNVGIFVKRNFGNSKFGLKTGLEYSYLVGSRNYKYDGTPGVLFNPEGEEFEYINNHFGVGAHNVSIPFIFYFTQNRIQPYLGLNYNHLETRTQTSPGGLKFISTSENIGFNIGTGFRLNEKFALNLEFKRNLTPDYRDSGADVSGLGIMALAESYKLKNNQVKISLAYSFQKKKKA